MQAAVDVELTGLVKLQHSSPMAGSEFQVRGALELQQRIALREGSRLIDTDMSLFRHNISNPYQMVRAKNCGVATALRTCIAVLHLL